MNGPFFIPTAIHAKVNLLSSKTINKVNHGQLECKRHPFYYRQAYWSCRATRQALCRHQSHL